MYDKKTVTRPGSLYYTKSMSIIVFSNIYTPIGLINRAKYQAVDIILDNNNMSNIW